MGKPNGKVSFKTWHVARFRLPTCVVLIGVSFSTFSIKSFGFFFSKFSGEDTCLNLPWESSPFVLCIDMVLIGYKIDLT